MRDSVCVVTGTNHAAPGVQNIGDATLCHISSMAATQFFAHAMLFGYYYSFFT